MRHVEVSGIGGNWKHLTDQLNDRVQDQTRAVNVITALGKKAKDRTLPNRDWYRPVTVGKKSNKKTLAYVCGQGCYLSTVLSGDMIPRGELV